MSRKQTGPSQRQLRVGELVRHALSDVLVRERLPDEGRLPDGGAVDASLVSISEVRMSPDLRIATAYVAPLGAEGGTEGGAQGSADAKAVSQALARNAKFLRGRAAPLLSQLKFMPSFRFLPDTSFSNFARIDAILRSPAVARDLDRDTGDRDAGDSGTGDGGENG